MKWAAFGREHFYREKQVQGWSRKKKEALIQKAPEQLHALAECRNETHFRNLKKEEKHGAFDSAQAPYYSDG